MARRRKKGLKKEMRSQIKGILLLALASFALLGVINPGQTGGFGLFLNNLLHSLAGRGALVIPLFLILLAVRAFLPLNKQRLKIRMTGLFILSGLLITWFHLNFLIEVGTTLTYPESIRFGLAQEGGGLIGALIATGLFLIVGPLGGQILIYSLAIIAILLLFDLSINKMVKTLTRSLTFLYGVTVKFLKFLLQLLGSAGRYMAGQLAAVQAKRNSTLEIKSTAAEPQQMAEAQPDGEAEQTSLPGFTNTDTHLQHDLPSHKKEADESLAALKEVAPDTAESNGHPPMVTVSRNEKRPDYIFPPLDLLALPSGSEDQQNRDSKDRARLLEKTLASFGVKAKVIHVQSGPTVTRFEVQPEAGVKVSKISSLADDLALNLAAPLVRIEAPIPGKAALGIEVPNQQISLVNLREVMVDRAFEFSQSPLTVALGKDITGNAVIADLTKMPHLLIAGATGAGKSVCLNTIITSILYKAAPEQVRFMMIDPKVVELSVYNGIPHLIMPVVTDPRKASLALRNMVREMGRRYDLFARLGVRDIGAYNQLTTEDVELEALTYIVVIIDELADLMLVSPGEVEDSIARLAQMSRAAGIHLLVATQRPSVDVLTGIIKANITSRVAFTVSSQFDSRTILDMAGAEKLLGRGDMLFYPVGAVKPFRVQGAFISEGEVKKVTDFIKEQGIFEPAEGEVFLENVEETEHEEMDDLFAEAIDLVVRTGQASISLLQRRFRIGYTRAARLIDDLERRGIVGPFEGSKPREVMITEEQALEICKEFETRE